MVKLTRYLSEVSHRRPRREAVNLSSADPSSPILGDQVPVANLWEHTGVRLAGDSLDRMLVHHRATRTVGNLDTPICLIRFFWTVGGASHGWELTLEIRKPLGSLNGAPIHFLPISCPVVSPFFPHCKIKGCLLLLYFVC